MDDPPANPKRKQRTPPQTHSQHKRSIHQKKTGPAEAMPPHHHHKVRDTTNTNGRGTDVMKAATDTDTDPHPKQRNINERLTKLELCGG